MSDGPHRTLEMRRGWRKVAEAADNPAAAAEELAEAIPDALKQDWNKEVPDRLIRGLKDVLADDQGSLFADDRSEKLEALRSEAAGATLGAILLDHAVETAATGKAGHDAVIDATEGALMERGAAGSRQVEEHYLRETSEGRSSNVRSRIENGIRQAPIRELARELVGIGTGRTVTPPRKQSGVDDGVEL